MKLICQFCKKHFTVNINSIDLFSEDNKGCCSDCYNKLLRNPKYFRVRINVKKNNAKSFDAFEGIYVEKEQSIAYECGDWEANVDLELALQHKIPDFIPKKKRKVKRKRTAKTNKRNLKPQVIKVMNNKEILFNGRKAVLKVSEDSASIQYNEKEQKIISVLKLFILLSSNEFQFSEKNHFDEGCLLIEKSTKQLFWYKKSEDTPIINALEISKSTETQKNLGDFCKFTFEQEFLKTFLEVNYFDKVKLSANEIKTSQKIYTRIINFHKSPNSLQTHETAKEEVLSLLNLFQNSKDTLIQKFSNLTTFFDPFAGSNNIKNIFSEYYQYDTFLSNDIKSFQNVEHDFNFDIFNQIKLEKYIKQSENFPKTLIFSPPFSYIDLAIVYFIRVEHFENLIIHVPLEWDEEKKFGYRTKFLNYLLKDFHIGLFSIGIRTNLYKLNKFILMTRKQEEEKSSKIRYFNLDYARK
eukprot:snap_masked-scaffold_5-processed-gene-17.46-mRNA-1 protein AED:1.00 eAED:1.00 QI:0/0/0/0/1/1/2/0/466